MMRKHKRRIIIILFIIGLIVLLRFLGLTQYFSFAYLKTSSDFFKQFLEKNYWNAVGIYIGIYAILVAVGVPSVAPLTLLGGFLFGVLSGAAYAVISGTIGSLVTFLFIRYLFGAVLQKRYKERLQRFNKQIQEHGVNYLLMLHFLSVVPYFVINSLAALTNISFWTFLWTTVIGSIPLALIYSFAGLQLSNIESARDIFSPSLIILLFLLVLLALMPILIRKYRRRLRSDYDSLF